MSMLVPVTVVMMVILSAVPLSDAESSQGIEDIAVSIYDKETSYSDLVYMGEDLPDMLHASEWLKDTDGLWYNINSLSSNYGKVLTNGMISGITDDEIRSDLLAKFPVLDADFVLLQMTYKINYECNVTVKVEKDSVEKYNNVSDISPMVSHYYFSSGLHRAVLLTVKNDPLANINVDNVRGNYTATLSYNGIQGGSLSYDYLSSKLSAGGTLLNSAGEPIYGASVSFGSLGSVYSDAMGHFSMYVDYGSTPAIQAITLSGYTFSGLPISYGTITTDKSYDISAAERTLNVTVNDGSGVPVSGVQARGYWYHNDGSGMVIETEGLTTVGTTDSNGNLRIAVSETKRAAMDAAGAKLYIVGVDGTSYTFETDVMPGPGSSASMPVLTEPGNVYADTSTLADVAIATIEKSVTVIVRGALDALSAGGSQLPNAIVSAVWYYQTYDGAAYMISLASDIEPGTFVNLTEGHVRIVSPYTDNDGEVRVVYREPTWDVDIGVETAHLYITVSGADPTSATSEFNFTTATITDGDKSIEELTADTAASKAKEMSAISDVTLYADEVAYTVNGTVTGSMPATFNAFRITATQHADTFSVDGTTGTFRFPVKAGTSNTIELDTVEGYEFSNPSEVLPTATADQAFSSTCTRDTGGTSRSPVVSVAHYTVTGAKVGIVVSATYQVAGVQVKSDVISDSDTIDVFMFGRAGNIAEDVMITGTSDFYVGPISGTTAQGYEVASRKVVLYVNSGTTGPATDNVVAGTEVQVYCGGKQYATVTSDVAGTATSNLPEIGALIFKVGDYTASAAVMTSGPYTGYIAVNLAGIVNPPAPAEVTLTVRYIASASMQNTETPTNIDVMNSPMSLKYAVGSSQTFKAPELTGFEFAGWFLDGQLVSNPRDITQCTVSITAAMEGSELVASYSAENPPQPTPDNGPIIAAGVLSVTLSMIALMVVIMQKRRY